MSALDTRAMPALWPQVHPDAQRPITRPRGAQRVFDLLVVVADAAAAAVDLPVAATDDRRRQ
ncbi:hypothetical protein GCM10010411_75350 [Actinomadura fulvescens]|uniref:Uncharacterized protein n=1 Tax=Actinomadura fulvescens TaxID=46160 RepID=A0ABN3QIF9_9ACTN